jgi:hypothetical protein
MWKVECHHQHSTRDYSGLEPSKTIHAYAWNYCNNAKLSDKNFAGVIAEEALVV